MDKNKIVLPTLPTIPDPHRLIRVSDIVGDRKQNIPGLISVSRSTWWAWVAAGKAPKPVRLGSRVTAWRYSDVIGMADREV